ncbi:MAG: PspC domain-containing protein [Patescibacteria group bacterium]
MQKITSIHLNGKAYQLEESGFEALRAYLATAETKLAENPDKTEIMSDLEQAIGEKCRAFLNPNKDVVTSAEVEQVIREMGPVDGPAEEKKTGESASSTKEQEGTRSAKRFYLILENSLIGGVCTGLAAYFNLDLTLVRVSFVVLTIVTGGAMIPLYIALMFLVPYANTSEERAAAHGESFNAQEVVNRAKESYSRLANKHEWHKQKAQMRKMHSEIRAKANEWKYQYRYTPRTPRAFSSFFGLVSVIVAVIWIAALISLINTGAIFGWMVTSQLPLWAAIALLFIGYHAITGPLRGTHDMRYVNNPEMYHRDGLMAVADTMSAVFIVIVGWFAYTHYPPVHDFVNAIPGQVQHFIDGMRNR